MIRHVWQTKLASSLVNFLSHDNIIIIITVIIAVLYSMHTFRGRAAFCFVGCDALLAYEDKTKKQTLYLNTGWSSSLNRYERRLLTLEATLVTAHGQQAASSLLSV